jgi:hypothetical protein
VKIDTKEIKKRAQQGLENHVSYSQMVIDLCDHIEELERKLKIAEEALDFYSNKDGEPLDHEGYTARNALKQIRGEE